MGDPTGARAEEAPRPPVESECLERKSQKNYSLIYIVLIKNPSMKSDIGSYEGGNSPKIGVLTKVGKRDLPI